MAESPSPSKNQARDPGGERIASPEHEIETVAYQANAAARSRPCGAYPCMNEYPGRPSRWCSGCLIAALSAAPAVPQPDFEREIVIAKAEVYACARLEDLGQFIEDRMRFAFKLGQVAP